ncbi:hypothetical protein [Tsuneonella sp. HG222]
MQDTLMMRHWAAHHEEFSAAVTATLAKAAAKFWPARPIGSAYGRWSAARGPALLAGSIASVATTAMIAALLTVVMPLGAASQGDSAIAVETPQAGAPRPA